MLLKHRPPGIDSQPARLREGLEHLEQTSIAVLRWLVANKVDFVVVGPVAQAIRGDVYAKGPVAIVPAPYGRTSNGSAPRWWPNTPACAPTAAVALAERSGRWRSS